MDHVAGRLPDLWRLKIVSYPAIRLLCSTCFGINARGVPSRFPTEPGPTPTEPARLLNPAGGPHGSAYWNSSAGPLSIITRYSPTAARVLGQRRAWLLVPKRPLVDHKVAGNSPVFSHGCKFPLPVAKRVAGKPGLFLPGRKLYVVVQRLGPLK